MAELTYRELEVGKNVWYKYADFAVEGPFLVKGFRQDYEGRHVRLKDSRGDRYVPLANDDVYGAPYFYDCPPEST